MNSWKEFGKEVWDFWMNMPSSPKEEGSPVVVKVNLEDNLSCNSASLEWSLDKSWFNVWEMHDNSLKEFESNTKTMQKCLTNRHLSLK